MLDDKNRGHFLGNWHNLHDIQNGKEWLSANCRELANKPGHPAMKVGGKPHKRKLEALLSGQNNQK